MEANNNLSGDGGLLPEDIYDKIVEYLPIRDAIQTAPVSRSWRYRWKSTPNLVIDRAPNPRKDRFVGQVLKLHDWRSIRTFKVSLNPYNNNPLCVAQWIRSLAASSTLESFTVLAECQDHYILDIPRELFCHQHLTRIELYGCRMVVPTEFKGFPCLTELVMNKVDYVEQPTSPMVRFLTLGAFLSSCTKLRRLQIDALFPGGPAEISLPDLRSFQFTFKRVYTRIRLNAPKLTSARLTVQRFHSIYFGIVDALEDGTLTTFLDNCALIEELEICDHHFGVPEGYHADVPRRFTYSFNRLKSLNLDLRMHCPYRGTLIILCVLRSSPVLKHLRLSVDFPDFYDDSYYDPPRGFCHYHNASFWEAQLFGCVFNGIEKLDFNHVEGDQYEMALFKLLLKSTPSLLEINVRVAPKRRSQIKLDDCQIMMIVKDLLTVKRDAVQGILRHDNGLIIF